jgi:hypothetical protein
MIVTANNQCSNIKLKSPIYFIRDTTCHIQFPQQVNSKNRTEVSFEIGIDRDTFGGILLYHLKRKKKVKSDNQFNTDKDASIDTQLLVIWGRNSEDKPYSCGYLIEHESVLTWNEDNLKRLHHIYDSQQKAYSKIDRGWWLLDDNTELKTKCELLHESLEMEIIISEEKYLSLPRKPLYINPNK